MKASDRAIRLIAEFEGFASEPYDDEGGKRTIGFGHVIRKGESFTKIDETEATRLLCADLEIAEACVESCVDVDLTQSQFDAICSFVFNLGRGALAKSTLLKLLNQADYAGAAAQFDRWTTAGGRKLAGLIKRREAERKMFEGKS